MIDMISKGRLVSGFVRGGGQEQLSAGVNPAFNRERFVEAHDLIVRAWTEAGPFRHEGTHYQHRVVNPWAVRRVFQDHDLPEGRMRWRGAPLRLDAIQRTSIMVVEGGRDDICGAGQTAAALELCRNVRHCFVVAQLDRIFSISGRLHEGVVLAVTDEI